MICRLRPLPAARTRVRRQLLHAGASATMPAASRGQAQRQQPAPAGLAKAPTPLNAIASAQLRQWLGGHELTLMQVGGRGARAPPAPPIDGPDPRTVPASLAADKASARRARHPTPPHPTPHLTRLCPVPPARRSTACAMWGRGWRSAARASS